MLASIALPPDVRPVRATPTFTADDTPVGLRQAHRLAAAVWGVLEVTGGVVTFVDEGSGERREVRVGEHQVIAPDSPHHVEPGRGATFRISFHR